MEPVAGIEPAISRLRGERVSFNTLLAQSCVQGATPCSPATNTLAGRLKRSTESLEILFPVAKPYLSSLTGSVFCSQRCRGFNARKKMVQALGTAPRTVANQATVILVSPCLD
jgi:hypothetical protein